MTIANFKKMTLFGETQFKKAILKKLQAMGCVQLIAIDPKKRSRLTHVATTLVDNIKKALQYLKDAPEQAKPKKRAKPFAADNIVQQTLSNQTQLREAIDRQDFLQKRIHDLAKWGSFTFPEQNELANVRLWFYQIKHYQLHAIPKDYVIHEVYRDPHFVYLVVLSVEEPPANAFPSPRIHTGAVPLAALKKELAEVIEKIDDLQEERRHLTRYRLLLSKEIDHFKNRLALQQAKQKSHDQEQFFIMQGWVPEAKLATIHQFCKEQQLGIAIEAPSPKELPPTLMQTYPWASAGVELINFYQTPGYHSLDPSFMLFFSFSLFFAIILADAGYGLVIALFTLLTWKWLGRFRSHTWFRPLLVTISLFSIIYGVLLGSYFGVEPSEHSFLGHMKILNINNFAMMIKFVIVIGCLHIIAANAMRAWFATHAAIKMQSLGFIVLILSCLLLAWSFIQHHPTLMYFAIAIAITSLLVLMVFASDLPVTNVKSLVHRIVSGLETLSHLSALFSDVLSYLRLFALGLAGASLAVTFNHMAVNAAHAIPGIGWIFAFLILLLGQTLNFALCIMGGVIHGLRLNYIEFYKWSIQEEGYAYQPFKKI